MHLKISITLFIYFILSVPSYCQDFGYDGNEGPTHWAEKYNKCVGKHQSPVDIEDDNVTMVKFPPMVFNHFDNKIEEVKLMNNGHTVILTISKGKIPLIHGGPLKEKYIFTQLHFHWGHSDTEGSENVINNHSFPMELHMVFFKESSQNFENALRDTDGLTVLSFLYHAYNKENKNYNQFENKLNNVRNETTHSVIKNFVSLTKFTIKDRNSYYTYIGSLTTPPCSETVIWIEFKNTISLSHKQIQAFRLLSGRYGQLTHNFRPIQPLYDRVIYMNSISSLNKASKCFITVLVLSLVIVYL